MYLVKTGLLEQYKHSSQLSCECHSLESLGVREVNSLSFYRQEAQACSRTVAFSSGMLGVCGKQRAECRVPVLHLFPQDSSCPHSSLKNIHLKAETVVFSSVPD